MEEKPNENPSDSTQQSSSGGGSGDKSNNMNATTEKIISDVKKFNILSLVGLGLVVVFLVFMLISAFNYKWWLMLTIAGASGFLMYRQHSDTSGFEKKACFYGMIVLGVLLVGRDIGMSNTLNAWNSAAGKAAQAVEQMKKGLPGK